MVEAIQQKSSVGPQPRSLFINWMKYDVTDDKENIIPSQDDVPIKLSPLRQKLQARAEQVIKKRQLMTREETENRIEDARIRREITSQEAVLRRVEPKMRRSQKQHVRQTYLSQMADKRHRHLKQVYLSQMAPRQTGPRRGYRPRDSAEHQENPRERSFSPVYGCRGR